MKRQWLIENSDIPIRYILTKDDNPGLLSAYAWI